MTVDRKTLPARVKVRVVTVRKETQYRKKLYNSTKIHQINQERTYQRRKFHYKFPRKVKSSNTFISQNKNT